MAAVTLARAGVLDGLSSDYVPGSLLQAAWILHHKADWGMSDAIGVVSRGPARAAGLADRGEIAVGLLGDLIRVREVDDHPVVHQVFVGGRRVA